MIKNIIKLLVFFALFCVPKGIQPQEQSIETENTPATELPDDVPIIKMPLELPLIREIFGTLTLEGGINLDQGSFYFKSYRSEKPLIPELIPGLLDIISPPKVEFSSELGLKVTVETNLFGLKAEAGLVNLNIDPNDLNVFFVELYEANLEKKMAQKQLAAERRAGLVSKKETIDQAKEGSVSAAINPILMQLQSSVTFGITPITPLKIDIPGSRSIELKNVGLFLKPAMPSAITPLPLDAKLFALIDFFSRDGQPNTIIEFGKETVFVKKGPPELEPTPPPPGQFPLPTAVTYGKLNVTDLAISSFIPTAEGTPFGEVAIKDVEVRLQDMFKKGSETITFNGQADLTSLSEILPFGIQLGSLNTKGIIDHSGFSLKTSLGLQIPFIPNLVTLKNPSLMITNRFVDRPDLTLLEIQQMIHILMDENAPKEAKKSIPKDINITLSGEIELELPELGVIQARLSSSFGPKGFTKFDGIVKNDVNFYDQFSLENARIQCWPSKQRIQISTATRILEIDITANLMVEQPKTKIVKGEKIPGKLNVSFWGTLAQKKDLVPFKGLGSPLETIKLSNLTLGFNIAQKAFYFQGTSEILGFGVTCALEKTPAYTTLHAKLADTFKISNMLPEAAGTFLDDIDLTNIHLVASSESHRSFRILPYPVQVSKGINLFAEFNLTNLPLDNQQQELLKTAQDVLQLIPKSVMIQGGLGETLADLNLRAMLNLDIDLRKLPVPETLGWVKPPIRLSSLNVGIDGDGPNINLFGEIEFFPPGQKDSLTFMAKGDVNPNNIELAGTMLGTWDLWFIERFTKIKLQLTDISLNLGWDFSLSQQLATATAVAGGAGALIPTVFGIAGTVQIGKTKVGAKIKIEGDNIADWGLEAFADHLSISSLVDLMQQTIQVPIPQEGIPELGIFDARILASLKGALVGGVRIPPGLIVKGKLKWYDFFKQEEVFALVDVGVSLDGLTCRGTFPEIHIGPLLVTGKGLKNEKQKGPAIDFELSLKRQLFMLSGLVEFFGAKTETNFYLGKNGISFETMTKLYNIFEVELTGKSTGSGKNLDFIIDGRLKNDFFEFVKNGVGDALDALNADVQTKLKTAQSEVSKLNADIASIDNQIKLKEEKIAQLQKIIDQKKIKAGKKADAAAQKIGLGQLDKTLEKGIADISKTQKDLRAKVDKDLTAAQKEVDKILDEIKKTEKRRDECANAPWFWTKEKAEWTFLTTIKLPALWASHKVASNTLEAIKEANKHIPTVGEIKETIETTVYDPSSLAEAAQIVKLDLERMELKSRKQVVIAAKEQALYHLKNVGQMSDFSTEVAKDAQATVAQGPLGDMISGMLVIREAHVHGSMKEILSQGKLPEIRLKVDFMNNKGVEGTFQYDSKQPDLFFKDVAKFLTDLFIAKNQTGFK